MFFNENYSIAQRYDPKSKNLFSYPRQNDSIKPYFILSFREFNRRVLISLIPPVFDKRVRKIYVDFVGPFVAFLTLSLILSYGHRGRTSLTIQCHPIPALAVYTLTNTAACYVLCKLGGCSLKLVEIFVMLGYALYGHIFTIVLSLLLCDEDSNFVFFACMTVFGGLSTLRVVLLLVTAIGKPAVRLLAGSTVAVVQLLFLMFLHFAYMHRTFVYGSKA